MLKIKKRALCIALAIICVLSLCACGAVPASPAPEALSATPTPTPTPAPTPTPTPSPSPTPTPLPEYTGPDLAERERMDDEFFADALFVGNSLIHGLWGYGGINSATYCAATSASVVNLDRVKNEAFWGDRSYATTISYGITQGSYSKIYLLLGINEIGFETVDFIALYSNVLNMLTAAHPDADIYIMGLTPITEKKNAGGYPFTMERVLSYNEALRALAAERECWYVDLVELFADESGFMPAEISTDGIHLIQEEYARWGEYLRTHYADSQKND